MDASQHEEPEILYHYTDAGGLMGIVGNPTYPKPYNIEEFDFTGAIKILASDVRFMNDHAELRHAGRIFATRFREIAEDAALSDERRELLVQLADELERGDFLGEPIQQYVACFSADGDELSQWRGYAGGTGGYAIGVPKRALDHFTFALRLTEDPMTDYLVGGQLMRGPVRVSYDDAAAIAEAESLAQSVSATAPFQDPRPMFNAMWLTIERMARFKHPGFRREAEWRLIWFHSPAASRVSVPTEFRNNRFGVTPFLTIAINPVGHPAVPKLEKVWGRRGRTIEDLVVGPSSDQALRVSAARQLLETNGHDPSVVRASPIPFRG